MNNKNIIIILVTIIVILVIVIGLVVLHPFDSKEPCKIKITNNKTIYEGDNLSIKFTDLNKTPLSQKNLNITIYDSKGNVVADKVVKTDSKGKAELDLDLKKGEYTVNVTFDGDENYSANTTSKNIKIIEKEIVEPNPSTTETTSTSDNSQSSRKSKNYVDNDPLNLPYPIRAEDDKNGVRM